MTKSAVCCRFSHIYWRNSLWKTSLFVQWIYISTYKNSRPNLENSLSLSLSLSYIISPTMKCIMLIILITMTKHCLEHSNNNYPQEATFYSNRFIRNETYNKKIRLAKSRTLYYDNTVRHSVWFYQMIYLVTNKSLLHVQHATKQSVVTVKESIAPFVAVSPIWNVLHLIKKFYLHQCYTGFVCVVFKVFYLFIKCETYTS